MYESTTRRVLISVLILALFIFLAVGSVDDDDGDTSSEDQSQDNDSWSDDDEEEEEEERESLNADVSFTGTQFVITNNDYSNWRNVKLKINSGIFGGGYVYEASVLEAGETYKVGAMQFSKSGGERFDPYEMKPKEFDIVARVNGERRYWFGSFE